MLNFIKFFLLNTFMFCQLNSLCDLRKGSPRVHCGMNKLIAFFYYFWLYFTFTILFAVVIGVILIRDNK